MKERGHLHVTVSSGVGSFSNAALKTLLAKRDHISEALLVLVNRNLRGDFSANELELHIASRGVGVGKKADDPTAVRPVTVTDVMARWVGRLGLVPHKAAIIEYFTQHERVKQFAFSKGGAEAAFAHVQRHLEINPTHLVGGNDLQSAYNEGDRSAMWDSPAFSRTWWQSTASSLGSYSSAPASDHFG